MRTAKAATLSLGLGAAATLLGAALSGVVQSETLLPVLLPGFPVGSVFQASSRLSAITIGFGITWLLFAGIAFSGLRLLRRCHCVVGAVAASHALPRHISGISQGFPPVTSYRCDSCGRWWHALPASPPEPETYRCSAHPDAGR